MKNYLLKKGMIFTVILLLIQTSVQQSIVGNEEKTEDANSYLVSQTNHSQFPEIGKLDAQYIYNITRALSNIIFTEYDEKHGEIAKGREFGTKGEHKAAEIIYENMTKLGLYVCKEQIKNTPGNPKLTHKLEVMGYGLRVNDANVDCYIAPTWLGLRGQDKKLNCTFSYNGVEVKHKPRFPLLYNPKLAKETEDFVFIDENTWFNASANLINRSILNTINYKPYLFTLLEIQTKLWRKWYPHCQGLILYDFNNDTHDMINLDNRNVLPILFINGTVGKTIIGDINSVTIDYYLNQRYNTSVVSYNVIGQLNGTDPSKTVIIDCLYDCWWNQGTADSAIGMAMVLGLAKYFIEHNIKPKYNLKFIAFGGEEYFMRGAKYYEETHRYEKIIYVIDLNQLGFWQEKPRLTLDIIANKLLFLREIWKIIERSDYVNRTGNTANIIPLWISVGGPSDDTVFAQKRPSCKTVCFLKDCTWRLHHRDGLNHQEGDVLKYFDWNDVNVTGEIVLNVTKYLSVDR